MKMRMKYIFIATSFETKLLLMHNHNLGKTGKSPSSFTRKSMGDCYAFALIAINAPIMRMAYERDKSDKST